MTKAVNKPFYVVAESFKFVRLYPLNQQDVPNRFRVSWVTVFKQTNELEKAETVQWWEHSPPTNVAQVWFLDSASYVGWVNCHWFSSLLWEVFLRVLRFFPFLKNRHFQIPNWYGLLSSTLSWAYALGECASKPAKKKRLLCCWHWDSQLLRVPKRQNSYSKDTFDQFSNPINWLKVEKQTKQTETLKSTTLQLSLELSTTNLKPTCPT